MLSKPINLSRARFVARTHNLIPCLMFLAVTYGPGLVDTFSTRFAAGYSDANGDEASLAAPDLFQMRYRALRRPYGMAPAQFDRYRRACLQAHVVPIRIIQCIGYAAASAGTHEQDGFAHEGGVIYAYSAATDLSVRGLSRADIHKLLYALADKGFYGWYRYRGSFAYNQHLHMVCALYPMKASLRAQFHDAYHDRTGLVGHAYEPFFQLTAVQKIKLRALFVQRNPLVG